ncbi:MAG TPA: ABC transporter substrate-binding protein [Candidatus Paceibacterota bacterium]
MDENMPQNNPPPVTAPAGSSHVGIGKHLKTLFIIFGTIVVVGGGIGIAMQSGLIVLPTGVKKPVTIGIVQYVASLDQVYEGFKQGMKDLGYTEGSDIFYEYQNANGDVAKAKEIAAGYLAKNVDLIYTMSTSATKAAYDATVEANNQTPIVYGQSNVSIEIGTIKSYQSSGNNVTGVENVNADYIEKELDFLKRINPNAKKIGVFALVPPFQQLVTKDSVATIDRLAPQFNLTVVHYDVKVPPGPASVSAIQKLVDDIKPGDIDAIIHLSDPATNFKDTPTIFIKAQQRLKIPFMAIVLPHVQQGALLSYGSNFLEQGKQSAAIVDKVLKGKKPTNIPIEFSKKALIAVNLKTASELGLTIPDSILSIADIKVEK